MKKYVLIYDCQDKITQDPFRISLYVFANSVEDALVSGKEKVKRIKAIGFKLAYISQKETMP